MIGNLPAHPMLVHFAVAMMMATALLQLAAIVLPRVRAWAGWVTPALAVLTAVVTRVAQSFGEVLEHRLPRTDLIHAHAEWGEKAGLAAMALGLMAVAYWLATSTHPFAERRGAFLRGGGVRTGVAVATGLLCVAVLVLDVLAGHSGATSVWTH